MNGVDEPGTVTGVTAEQQAQAHGEQDAAIALAEEDRGRIARGGVLTVHPVEELTRATTAPPNLDGAASVLGYRPLIMA